MISANVRRPRWINYAAGLWAVLFAMPHVWWALGFPAGFPGGAANHQLMVSTWRFFFDVVVIFLSITAAFVALALVRPWGKAITRRILRIMAWIASSMLSLRGVAGLVADGTTDPVWWPTFLVGGILFGSVAWLARSPNPGISPAPTT
jgi:hypothetical protein